MATLPPTLPITRVSPSSRAASSCSKRLSRWLRLATSTSSPVQRRALSWGAKRSPLRFSRQALPAAGWDGALFTAALLAWGNRPNQSSSLSGSSTTPSTGVPRCTRARCTAYSPVPSRKSLVPSRGSSSHSHSPGNGNPSCSASAAVSSLSKVQGASGKDASRPCNNHSFTARSAAVTGPLPPSATVSAAAKPWGGCSPRA